MEEDWQFVDSGALPGHENMEYDERLAMRLLEGTACPTVRVFRWQPWAVSLGHHQNVDDIDIRKCAADGIDVVRRPTGGRAILHAEELTYSVVMPIGQRSVLQVYNSISKALLQGLQLFGVDAELQRSQPKFGEVYRHASSIPCFSSSARYEIEWRGRKLVGSAQRRYSNGCHEVVLQHGSILLGPAHVRLSEYIAGNDLRLQENVRRDLRQRTVCLQEILKQRIDHAPLVVCVRRGFELAWEIRFGKRETPVQRSASYG